MAARDETAMTERARAEEKVRAIIEELDRPTLALLYKTLHHALGFRVETADIAIGKLRRCAMAHPPRQSRDGVPAGSGANSRHRTGAILIPLGDPPCPPARP